MHAPFYNRRSFLVSAGLSAAALATGSSGLIRPAMAASGLAPTQSMRGGSNNYRPGAPLVDSLGSGFHVTGKVLNAADGQPLDGVRIQIWAATTLGGEREPKNHGSVLTQSDGSFALEMEQIVPNFGQPHAHLAYDDGAYQTVFLRPVMGSPSDTSVSADFVLAAA
ncbi:twin-arginine translocation signal domain-containing protein [Psychromarinibacter sp. S121]|uniref:twin-arginine translocation signal domain-containing protein n=1 Tax=Psychromarinibacter sp. S121 TaxID=3415127 RepID=UPI003C7A2001